MSWNSEQGIEMMQRVRRLMNEIEHDAMNAHPHHRAHMQAVWADHMAELSVKFQSAADRLLVASKGEAA